MVKIKRLLLALAITAAALVVSPPAANAIGTCTNGWTGCYENNGGWLWCNTANPAFAPTTSIGVRFYTNPFGSIGGYLAPGSCYGSNTANPQDWSSIAGFYVGPGWNVQMFKYRPDRGTGWPFSFAVPASGDGTIFKGGTRADGQPYYFTFARSYNYRVSAYRTPKGTTPQAAVG